MPNSVSVTVVGNLTDDPELRFTPSGQAVCKLTVAFNPRYRDKQSGEWKDGEPSFYRCTAWQQLAENIAESLHKGDRVIVQASQSQRSWDDKNEPGKKVYGWQWTIDAIGPELAWATTTVKKAARHGRDDIPPDDPWSTGSRTVPADREPAF